MFKMNLLMTVLKKCFRIALAFLPPKFDKVCFIRQAMSRKKSIYFQPLRIPIEQTIFIIIIKSI